MLAINLWDTMLFEKLLFSRSEVGELAPTVKPISTKINHSPFKALHKMLMVVVKSCNDSFVLMEYGNSYQTYANSLLQCVQVFHIVNRVAFLLLGCSLLFFLWIFLDHYYVHHASHAIDKFSPMSVSLKNQVHLGELYWLKVK